MPGYFSQRAGSGDKGPGNEVGACHRQRRTGMSVSSTASASSGQRPRPSYTPKNTWTKVFVCLAKKYQTTVPSAAEKIALASSGLGEQKITFHKDGNCAHVHGKLMTTFPSLANAGGYDVLRSSEGRAKTLLEITASPNGYSVSYLQSVLGQAKAYLRPIQRSIQLEDIQAAGSHREQEESPKVNCVNCHLSIQMNQIREHQSDCQNKLLDVTHPHQSGTGKHDAIIIPSTDLKNIPGTSPSTSTKTSNDTSDKMSSSSSTGGNHVEKQLQEMFPQKSPEEIKQAVDGNEMEMAIKHLLKDNQDLDSENDDWWDLPLSSAKQRKLNGIESLKEFIDKVLILQDEEEYLSITREMSIFGQVIRKYKNPMFSLRKPLNVQFRSSDATEPGVDAGGPTTEYFYLLMKELERGNYNGIKLLEGECGHWLPKFDYDLASGGMFRLVGRMILHAVTHNCRGLSGISPAIVSYIFSGRRDTVLEHLDIKDIPDPCLRNNLSKLLVCNEDELKNFTDTDSPMNIADILVAAGFPHIEVTRDNKEVAYECSLIYEVITKRIPVLEDLRQGLSSEQSMGLSLLDIANMHSEVMYLIFPDESNKIDLQQLKKLIQYHITEENPDALTAKTFFKQYMEELNGREGSDEETLNDLLQFWTGWPSLPMLEEKLRVTFFPKDESKELAVADTCWKSLKIPVIYLDYEAFKEKLDISVKYGKVGFGKM